MIKTTKTTTNHQVFKGKLMEIAYSTTLYFTVPEGLTVVQHIANLSSMSKLEMLKQATDFGDGGWEVMADDEEEEESLSPQLDQLKALFIDFNKRILKVSEKNNTVWVGGTEVNDSLLSKKDADIIANKWRADGYTDVVIEQLTSDHNDSVESSNNKVSEPKYLIDIATMMLDRPNKTIMEVELVTLLNHEPKSVTDLLVAEVNGECYTLRVSDCITFYHPKYADIELGPEERLELLFAAWETGDEEFTTGVSMPYIEWVSENGDIIKHDSDHIHADPQKEIDDLVIMLASEIEVDDRPSP